MRWTRDAFSKKLEEKREVWKGIEQQVVRAGTLKFTWDKSIGESILGERKSDRKDRLDVC